MCFYALHNAHTSYTVAELLANVSIIIKFHLSKKKSLSNFLKELLLPWGTRRPTLGFNNLNLYFQDPISFPTFIKRFCVQVATIASIRKKTQIFKCNRVELNGNTKV